MQVEDVMNDELFEFISTFSNAGGVLYIYVLKAIDANDATEEEIHFNIAKETMLSITGGESIPYPPSFIGTNSNNEHYSFNESKLVGTAEKLSVKDFFGAHNNFEQDRQYLAREGVPMRDTATKFAYNNMGYTYSFLDPPYGFSMPNKAEFFVAFSRYLFSDFGNIIVYSWGTDCSNYFNAGKDWWGHFLCTIYNPEKDWYIGIVASSTD